MTARLLLPLLACAVLLAACGRDDSPAETADAPTATGYGRITRTDFNQRAAALDLPVFWRADADGDRVLDPGELVALWGVGGGGRSVDYVTADAFTDTFARAYQRMLRPVRPVGPAPERERRTAVLAELAQGRPTLIEAELAAASAGERVLVETMLAAAALVERIYAKQKGVADFAAQVPENDPASHMLFWRNQGPFCVTPKMEKDPVCSAIPERPPRISGVYPATIQSGTDTRFCTALESRPDAEALLGPFTVVITRAEGDAGANPATAPLDTMPYSVAFRDDMRAISALLTKAAGAITDPSEAPLQLYLAAAAESFLSNDWEPTDEAWSRMNGANSKWYLRIGPDEVYEDPCSHKAMFHVSFGRINRDGLAWQGKLEPRKRAMESALAALAGAPYAERPVGFRLPDFVDVVLNAGDARKPFGAVLGQSLPNWGVVAKEGRGRTVAMVNLFTDEDSRASWRDTTSSLFCPATMERAVFDPQLDVMTTVLHEASHNLGPSHDYRVGGRTDDEIFGGPLASMFEELKAQTSALYFTEWLVREGLLSAEDAVRAHLGDVVWAMGHIATGMYDAEGAPKPYSHVAAIQLGILAREGVLSWREGATAANGKDRGCFDVDSVALPAAVQKLEAQVLRIKASGDRAGAERLKAEFVDAKDEWAKAREVIRERYLRAPKATLVYAIGE